MSALNAIGLQVCRAKRLIFSQACLKLLPWAGGLVVVAMLAFALYVRSVPPKQVINLTSASNTASSRFDPDFMKAMNRPVPVAKENPPEVKESDNAETIEL